MSIPDSFTPSFRGMETYIPELWKPQMHSLKCIYASFGVNTF